MPTSSSREGSGQTGRLERIVYGNQPPPAVAHATPAAGASPLHVDFSADESLDPDGDAVTYAWDFGDGSAGRHRADREPHVPELRRLHGDG